MAQPGYSTVKSSRVRRSRLISAAALWTADRETDGFLAMALDGLNSHTGADLRHPRGDGVPPLWPRQAREAKFFLTYP
jgi:hypothetical protein